MIRRQAVCLAFTHYFSYWISVPAGGCDNKMRTVDGDGMIGEKFAYDGENGGVRPLFYMESGTAFVGGDGTKEAPYIIDTPEEKASAAQVTGIINEIPAEIILTEECEAKVTAARAAYDSLPQKVRNMILYQVSQKLKDAEQALKDLKKESETTKKVDDVIGKIEVSNRRRFVK